MLKKTLDKESKGLILTKFPETFSKSKLGLKLSKKQVDARCEGINAWIAECISKLDEMNEKELELMSDFMDLKHLSVKGTTARRATKLIESAWIQKKKAKEEAAKKQRKGSGLFGRKPSDIKVEVLPGEDVPRTRGCGCVIS